MDNFRPSSVITGIVSVLIIGAVFITAIAGRIYTGGATFYAEMQTNSNRSQSNTANAATNRSLPANTTGSFPSGGGMTGNLNTGNTYTGNTYTAPTPPPSVSNSYAGNTSDETEKPSATTSQFNGRITADDIYIDALPTKENPRPDSESQYLPKGTPIRIVCRVEKLVYRVNTRDGNTADINAYSIEFTTENKQVPNCSSYNEERNF